MINKSKNKILAGSLLHLASSILISCHVNLRNFDMFTMRVLVLLSIGKWLSGLLPGFSTISSINHGREVHDP